ncbi:hypothetical protein RF11_04238 [Thelohanellus kitauei]|uniref:Uncharacterized protein n=1 Tax=Thelohanellus kitauei TaxID=669202 RepID=A0A0C2MV99_THEKT|nr:hypothetical protein RF11_04238 [Thelohanellus kitauei]
MCFNKLKDKFTYNDIAPSNKIVNMGSQIFGISSSENDSSFMQDSLSVDLVDICENSVKTNLESVFGSCSCDKLKCELQNKIFEIDIDDIFNVLYDDKSIMMKNVHKNLNFKGV